MLIYCACWYTVHVDILYMLIYCTCWYTVHVDILCMLIYCAFWYTVHVDALCMLIYCTCWYTVHVDILCMLIYCACWYTVHVDTLCMLIYCACCRVYIIRWPVSAELVSASPTLQASSQRPNAKTPHSDIQQLQIHTDMNTNLYRINVKCCPMNAVRRTGEWRYISTHS